jgi:chromosome segregation ATPase
MTPTLIAIVAAIAGPLGAYLVAARRFSGKIASSDATDLWKESSAIRDWSGNQITLLSENVSRLEERVHDLENAERELSRENSRLVRKNEALRGQVRALSTELAQCRRKITDLEAQIA